MKYLGEGGYGRVYEIERELSGLKEQAALKVVSRPADDAEIEACYENGYGRRTFILSTIPVSPLFTDSGSDESSTCYFRPTS